jgi:hypothetical protein
MKSWLFCCILAMFSISLTAAQGEPAAAAPGEEKLTHQLIKAQGVQLDYQVWLPKGYLLDRRLHGLLLVEDPEGEAKKWPQIERFAVANEFVVVFMKTGLTDKPEMPNVIASELSRRYRIAVRSGILIARDDSFKDPKTEPVSFKVPIWNRLIGAYAQANLGRDFLDPSADYTWVCRDLKQWLFYSLTASQDGIMKSLGVTKILPLTKPEHVLITVITPSIAEEDFLPMILTQLLRRRCEDPLASSPWVMDVVGRQLKLLTDKDPAVQAMAWSLLDPLPASTPLSRNAQLQVKMKQARENFEKLHQKDVAWLVEFGRVEALSGFNMTKALEETLKSSISSLEAKLKLSPDSASLKLRLQDLQSLLKQWDAEGGKLSAELFIESLVL